MALARKRVEAEEQRAAVDAEYAKLRPPTPLKPPPPFDPIALAKSRVKAEQQREAVDAEYKKLKPRSALDSVLEAAEDFRGIIGGTLGKVAGVALDITARLRKASGGKAPKAEVPNLEAVTPPVATVAPDQAATGAPAAVSVGGASDAAIPVAELAESAGAAASGMAAVVPVVGAVVVAFTAAVAAFNALVSEANKMAKTAGEYSPEVAQAQSQAEIRQMIGDMRRARENSKELADMVRAQSEMQQKWEDVKAALMSKIIPVLTGIMEVLISLLGVASRTDIDKEKDDPTTLILKNSSLFEGTEF
jgi:hypothetical protein